MKHLLLPILLLLLLSGCAKERLYLENINAKYTIPFEWPIYRNQNKDLAYQGMSKRDLYREFDRILEKSSRKQGNEEWITFINWTTENPDDLITFYLVDNKVKEWNEGGQ